MGELSGRTAIVTGGAWEEGLSAAEGLLRAGARVSLWDDRTAELDRAVAELADQGLPPLALLVDVADASAVDAAFQATRAALGPIDVLCNFATLKNTYMYGPEARKPYEAIPFWELDLVRLRRALDVNVLGTLLCMRAVAPEMVERGSGCIVNTSTSPATQRSPGHIPYGPSKALVEALSQATAEQLAPSGVRVHVVQSGGQVNRRGRSDPSAQPSDWMVPQLLRLAAGALPY
jgi:NAD(P)-dependent dehydrogenase (short-subunit alcohol dehydrogenase family)